MSLRLDTPTQPVLPLPKNSVAWQRCCQLVSDAAARWQIYLHQIGSDSLIRWLQSELQVSVKLWPEDEPFDIWQVVEGLALTWEQASGPQRLVVVLSEAIEAAELRVPQEWVDIPGWAGDYYLAAFVDVDEQHLALWGYATYEQIKERGTYQADDRTYSLKDTELVEDFSVFWVAQQLLQSSVPVAINRRSSLAAISTVTVSSVQSENLLQRLANSPDPRLEIPFEQWSALISNPTWRKQLFQERQSTVRVGALQQGLVDLGQWINQQFGQGWQSIDQLLVQTPALQFRSVAMGDALAVRGKSFSLATAAGSVNVVMVVTLSIEADNRRNVRIALYPENRYPENRYPENRTVLPAAIELALMISGSVEPVHVVRSGEQDNYIQLPSFRCPPGRQFQVRVTFEDGSVQSEFVS
ncbi:MAG: DUF1822 family protein [Cyanobacteria bacterium J06632_3]